MSTPRERRWAERRRGPGTTLQENLASVHVEEKELAKQREDQWPEGEEGSQERVCSRERRGE